MNSKTFLKNAMIVAITTMGLVAGSAAACADLPGWGSFPGMGSLPGAGGFPGMGSFPGVGTWPGWSGLGSGTGTGAGLPSFGGLPGVNGFGGTGTGTGTTTGGTQETYSNSAGSRTYTVYAPKTLPTHPGLVVVLHGCFMTGDNMAQGTGLNTYADKKGFIVIYPEQTYSDNSWKCWNWFDPKSQQRDTGEASIIVGMTKTVISKYNVDPNHVVITGLSAGAAMAANILGCYSDLYTGGLFASGLEFAAAQSESEGDTVTTAGATNDMNKSAEQAYNCSPKRATLIPVIITHGTSDSTVNPVNADRNAEIFTKVNTMIFEANGGNAADVKEASKHLGADGTHTDTATETDSEFGGKTFVSKIMIDGMGHGWSGGNSAAPFMQPAGPDASALLVNTFFGN